MLSNAGHEQCAARPRDFTQRAQTKLFSLEDNNTRNNTRQDQHPAEESSRRGKGRHLVVGTPPAMCPHAQPLPPTPHPPLIRPFLSHPIPHLSSAFSSSSAAGQLLCAWLEPTLHIIALSLAALASTNFAQYGLSDPEDRCNKWRGFCKIHGRDGLT